MEKVTVKRNNNSPYYQDESEFNFKRYFGLFLSNWYWFGIALFVSLIVAYGINTYSERIYSVSASLLINDEKGTQDMNSLDKLLVGNDIFSSKQNLQNEIGILKSYSLNLRVMEDLKDFHTSIVQVGRRGIAQHRMYKNAPFKVITDTLHQQSAGVQFSIKLNSDTTFLISNSIDNNTRELKYQELYKENGFNFSIKKLDTLNRFSENSANKYFFWFNNPKTLANQYRGKLSINPINDEATLVTLQVQGIVPEQEAEYLNKLIQEYIQQGVENKNLAAENTIEFIDKQLKQISDALGKAEEKLEIFRLTNKLIDLSSEGSEIKSKLEKYTSEKVSFSLQKQYYLYLLEYIETRNESGDIISPSIMGISDQYLVGLIETLSRLQEEKKQLKFSFTGETPASKLVDTKIEEVRMALKENITNGLENINITLRDVDNRIGTVETELLKLPGTERKLINIQREFELNNTVYTYMLEKRSEASIAKAASVSGSRPVDWAESYNSTLIKPTKNKNYFIAFLLGILLPGIYIFLIDHFHNRILDKKDIENGTDAPVIGFIGHNVSKNEMPVITKPGSTLSESFRSVRTNLKYYLKAEQKAVIAVTSTLSGEGKTFVSLNLAAVLSMLGKKTLIIGMDLRKPRLNKLLNISTTTGLTNFLIGEAEYEDILLQTEVKNLYFIPSGAIPPNPSELIESETMKQFILRVREDFDYIVIDTPPVGIVSDALLLSDFSDLTIFVLRQRYSFKSTLEFIQTLYEKKEIKNLVVAVNDIHITGYYGYGLRYGYGFYEGYGYNYGYSQYKSYGKNYGESYYTDK